MLMKIRVGKIERYEEMKKWWKIYEGEEKEGRKDVKKLKSRKERRGKNIHERE